jgi:hypothetical protein
MELLRALTTSYVIVTLGSTSLAKLKNWRIVSVGMLRERTIPVGVVPAVIITAATVELLLATLLMLGIEPVATSTAAAGLFLSFGGYRLAVSVKTNSLMCVCAGAIRTDPASPPAVAGAILACLIQASLACTLVFLGGRHGGGLFDLLAISAWMIPFIAFVAGALRRSGRSDIDKRFPTEFAR